MIKDIYTIERRVDLRKVCCRIDDYIRKQTKAFNYNFYSDISTYIKFFEHKNGALNLQEYFEDLGIDTEDFKNEIILIKDETFLLYIQAILALSVFFIEDIASKNLYSSQDDYSDFFEPLFSMIKENLDLLNYTFYYSEDSKIIITKRDAHIDSVIGFIDDELVRQNILQYIDFRNENNIELKKSILSNLYVYYESMPSSNAKVLIKKSKFDKEIELSGIFRFIANNFNIRHHQKDEQFNTAIKEMSTDEISKVCDIAFYMFLEIVRIPVLFKLNDEFLEIKNKLLSITS